MARSKTTSRARAGLLAGAAAAAVLAFPAIASADVDSSVAGGVLTVSSDSADAITITSDGDGNVQVNAADPGTGEVLASTITSISVTGDAGANAIDLAGVTTGAFPAVTAVTVTGAAGTDTITGSDHADRLIGGDNNDDVSGGPGNDTIVWNGGDDNDLNEGGDGDDTIQVNGATADETFTVKPGPNGRVIFDRTPPTPTPVPGFFNIDIGTAERLDLNMNAGNDTVTADNGLPTTFVLDVEGADGDDSIDGGDAADLLSGGNGSDRIVPDDNPDGTLDVARGDAGDDTIVWNGGDDNDVNDGGEGADTSVVNGATASERFTIKPSQTPDRVRFDRTSQNPAPFSIDIGTTERLLLNASGGDDRIAGAKGLAGLIRTTLNGDDGNDVIAGTDAEDRLNGGKGHDVVNSRDKAEDLVDCGSGLDLARIDKRDFLRNCNIVLGGHLRVRVADKTLAAAGSIVALPLQCAGTRRCGGVVKLRHGGKTLASKKFKITQRKKTIRVKLNRRGRRLMANAPAKGRALTVQFDARDRRGNGWRSRSVVRVTR